jgi:hypothetical protein
MKCGFNICLFYIAIRYVGRYDYATASEQKTLVRLLVNVGIGFHLTGQLANRVVFPILLRFSYGEKLKNIYIKPLESHCMCFIWKRIGNES